MYICFLSVVVLLFSCRTGQNCIRRLDKRLAKKSRGGSFKPKKRVLASVSVAEAPEGAAAWAVCHGRVVTPPAEDSVSMEHDTSEEL